MEDSDQVYYFGDKLSIGLQFTANKLNQFSPKANSFLNRFAIHYSINKNSIYKEQPIHCSIYSTIFNIYSIYLS